MQIIHDRTSVDEAAMLIATFGENAVTEAAMRADKFRNAGNLALFCRWRQVERAVQFLQLEEVIGELH